ncbi:anti-phage dCTP deaminase [Thalassospira tepidiphila]|uniref:Cytidine deaminase n=1 Tax=Thalassospira tepidiphila TaxID=393657 RepID=A0ABX0WUG4_9PROT|nr:anti-phage dCTP deaminase [Thalassospira tepidiphila]NJB72954.1 cytidine deaminase [Thalassospira tepidiphila]
MKQSQTQTKRKEPEIFIGLVGAVGSDLSFVSARLEQEFNKAKYQTSEIRVSQILGECHKYKSRVHSDPPHPEDVRINTFMECGDDLRKSSSRGDILSILAISKIRQVRYEHHQKDNKPIEGKAYIINSLKHPAEVDLLREVYGDSFFLISVYSPRNERKQNLSKKIAKSNRSFDEDKYLDKAENLIEKDKKAQGEDLGQNVRDTFPLGDFFVDSSKDAEIEKQISRFISVIFNAPFVTPTRDEFGMFHAQSVALRSADLSRQVGALISATTGEIVASGCNEVPKAGGGSVWEGDDKDYRDFQLGHDTSAKMKNKIASELLGRLKDAGWLADEFARQDISDLTEKSLFEGDTAPFRGTRAASLLEFGRIVHAEMSAITEAARRGIPLAGTTLYCTTFPCHMCARHIIASGIQRVVYIEPYPKSMAKELYQKSIKVDHDTDADDGAVNFSPFLGIAPRKYMEFFTMPSKRKDSRGHVATWSANEAEPRVNTYPTYLEIEASHLSYLNDNNSTLGILAPSKDDSSKGDTNGQS